MRSSCHACRVNGKAPGEDCASLISAEDRGAGLGVQQSAAPLVKAHAVFLSVCRNAMPDSVGNGNVCLSSSWKSFSGAKNLPAVQG